MYSINSSSIVAIIIARGKQLKLVFYLVVVTSC